MVMRSGLGKFSADAMARAQELRTGLPLSSFASDGGPVDKEIDLLVRRLARRGLLEYRLGHTRDGKDQVVIEPQGPDYWPQAPKLGDSETVVLSRFAYLRRRGSEMVLESPRAGCVVQNLRSENRCRPCCVVHAATTRKNSGGRTAFRGSNYSHCWWIARSCSSSTLPAATGYERPRATTISFSGIFTISCSTPTAPRADRPIRWAEFILMPG